jgi:Helix-turn-helix domain
MNADLDEAQGQMRQRQLPVPQEFQQYLTSEQVANILQVSTDTVYRLFEGKAGVLDFGFPERRGKRIRRMLRIPPSAVRLVQAQFQSKVRQ